VLIRPINKLTILVLLASDDTDLQSASNDFQILPAGTVWDREQSLEEYQRD
jgi:hypothetical protein